MRACSSERGERGWERQERARDLHADWGDRAQRPGRGTARGIGYPRSTGPAGERRTGTIQSAIAAA